MLFQAQSTKEICDFVSSFSGDEDDPWSHGHPVQAVPHFLANPNAESRAVSLQQLELWYCAYAAKRGLTTFKRPESIVWASKFFWKINKDKKLPICTLAAIRLWTVPWRRTPSRFRLQRWSHFTQQLNSLFGCYLIWVLAIIAEISLLCKNCMDKLYVGFWVPWSVKHHLSNSSEVFFALRWAALPSWLADMFWQHDGSWNWPWTRADFSQRLNLRTGLGAMQELAFDFWIECYTQVELGSQGAKLSWYQDTNLMWFISTQGHDSNPLWFI